MRLNEPARLGAIAVVTAVSFLSPALSFAGAPIAKSEAPGHHVMLGAFEVTAPCDGAAAPAAAYLLFPGIGHIGPAGKGYVWLPANYSRP